VKILFFGSSDFSLGFLRHLADHSQVEVVGVVTTPPAQKGHGRKVSPTCIEDYARDQNLTVFSRAKIKIRHFLSRNFSFKAGCADGGKLWKVYSK